MTTHDHKGYSEEKCVRCGWVMGSPPLNCQNDDTPHRFPSQLQAEAERDGLRELNQQLTGCNQFLSTEQVRADVAEQRVAELEAALEGMESMREVAERERDELKQRATENWDSYENANRRIEELEAALREIAGLSAPASALNTKSLGDIARRALGGGEPSPQAGDLLVIPYRHGDIIPAGWTVEGDKMWRRADGTEVGRALGGGE